MAEPTYLRPTAGDAMARIAAHEDICAERYERINTTLNGFSEKFESLNRAAWTIVGAIGLSGLTLIGYMVTLIVPGFKHA